MVIMLTFCDHMENLSQNKWAPVTAASRDLRLRGEERSPPWRVAVSILNMQSRTTGKGWSSSLGLERGAKNSP
jgi:hypothetical protein